MIAIYFSSTGNTKHCVEKFIERLDGDIPAVSIEDEGCAELLKRHGDIILAYPVYFSDLPQIVREFICENSANFRGKNVFIIATMEIFSGNGAGCAARILKRAGAKITGGAHVRMPAFILDVVIFSYSAQKNERLIKEANAKLERIAEAFAAGKPPQEGLGVLCRIAFGAATMDEDLGQNAICQAQTEPRYVALQRMRRVREVLPDAKYKNRAL